MVLILALLHICLCLALANIILAVKENNCEDGYHLTYTLPMFEMCSEKEHPEMGILQTIPKLIPTPSLSVCSHVHTKLGIPPGIRTCRFSDCLQGPCENGWCEETMTSYKCHCQAGFTGRHCETRLANASGIPTLHKARPVVIDCPENINHSVELGYSELIVKWTPPIVTNTSLTPTIVANINPGSFINVTNETVEVIYTVTDESGWLDKSCSFNISFHYVDTTPPDVICLEDITMTIELGTPSVPIDFIQPSATDISGIANLVSANYDSGDDFPVGSTVVEYVFADESGNNATCNFNVTIDTIDTTLPDIIDCPLDREISAPFGVNTVTSFMWTQPTATDAAGIASIVSDHQSGVKVSNGNSLTVTYTVTDNSGLTNTKCSFTLSVVEEADTAPPEVQSCPSDQTFTAPVGTTTHSFTWSTPTATDAAGIASIDTDHESGVVVSVGNPITVTYTVTDNSQLTNTDCSFTLTVEQAADITPPVVSGCPVDQTYTAPVGTTTHSFIWSTPTATDAAGIASIDTDHESGVVVSVGNPITVTYTVTDNSQLTNTDCSFTLTVEQAASDWKCTSSKCYYLDANERSWQEAKNFCTNLNIITTSAGDRDPSLLFVDNDPDFEIIETLFSLSTGVWINCNDMATEGTLVCDVDGTGTSHTNTNWKDGEPGGGGQHDCVYVDLQYEQWVNKQCDTEFHTMCQVIL